ncbi:MAG: chain length determinant protein, partial [Kocuria rhizophila]
LASEDFFVIVDSPPLLPVTDGSLLATAVDGTVLVVRQGRTRKDHLEAAVENLAAVDAHLMGVVMNGVARSQRGGGYSYGYGYESTYHKSHEKYLSSVGSSAKKGRRSRRKARTRS